MCIRDRVALAVCLKSLLSTKGTRKPWQSSFEEGNYVVLTQLVSQVTHVFHVLNRLLRGFSFMKYPLQKYGECTTPDACIEKHVSHHIVSSVSLLYHIVSCLSAINLMGNCSSIFQFQIDMIWPVKIF